MSWWDAVLLAALAPLALAAVYQLVLWGLGPGRVPEAGDEPGEGHPLEPVVVLVPAHDEAELLPEALRSLDRQTRPPDRVVVLADRCVDDTAAVARAGGAEVWIRETGPAGKGALLRWALERWDGRPCVFAVLDADSEASRGWLEASLHRLGLGASAVQVHHGVRPRSGGVVEELMGASADVRRRVLGARERLGLASPLLGTGMVIRSEALLAGWDALGLTEDREMGILLLERGRPPAFVAREAVLSEPPGALGEARIQRLRWMQGEARLARLHAPRLLVSGLPGDRVRLEAALLLLVPSPALRTGLLALVAFLSLVIASSWVAVLGVATLAAEITPRLLSLLARGPRGLRALAAAPLFVAWKATLAVRSLLRPERAWRTAREGRRA